MKMLLSLALLFFVQLSVAQGLTAEQAQNFLHDSGLNDLINSMPDMMEQQLNIERLTARDSEQYEKVRSAISEAVSRVDGQSLSLNYLTSETKGEKLGEAINFLSSPLGQRISAEERAASTPQAQLEMQAYAMQLAEHPPSDARVSLVQNLATALNSDQVILKMVEGTFLSLADIAKGIDPKGAKVFKQQLEEEWQQIKPVLAKQFEQFVIMSAHYSYRNISDSDLQQYIAFLKTPGGQTYWHVGLDIIDLYLRNFVSELLVILPEQGIR